MLGALVVLAAVLVPATAAAAPSGCRFADTTIYWKPLLTNRDAYLNPAQHAVLKWHYASTPIRFQQVNSGANVGIADGNLGYFEGGDGVVKFNTGGIAYCQTSGNWKQGLVAWWNTYYTNKYSGEKKMSLMVHELGHAIGLDHETFTSCNYVSIMQPDTYTRYDKCRLTVPSHVDETFVKRIYG